MQAEANNTTPNTLTGTKGLQKAENIDENTIYREIRHTQKRGKKRKKEKTEKSQ